MSTMAACPPSRDSSRRLILALRIAFMSARRGSQTMERLPRARGTRPPFHAALEPTNDPSVGDGRGGAPAELGVVGNLLDRATGGGDLGALSGEEVATESGANCGPQ